MYNVKRGTYKINSKLQAKPDHAPRDKSQNSKLNLLISNIYNLSSNILLISVLASTFVNKIKNPIFLAPKFNFVVFIQLKI
jgi:hypothetical protein